MRGLDSRGGRGILELVPQRVVNGLPEFLRRHHLTWGEVARRTFISSRRLRALRAPHANPRLVLAERIAAGLGVSVEDLWTLPR